jgi:hypothetical protein
MVYFRHYLGIRLERLRKPKKILIHNNRYLDRDSSWVHDEYKTESFLLGHPALLEYIVTLCLSH